jgi:lysophospholipase L1-like esterase
MTCMTRLLFFGDSLTQGTYGISYVRLIQQQRPADTLLNAGINGDTSFNLFQRVDADVLAQRPDAVCIMIGINDTLSQVEPVLRPYYRWVKGNPGGHISPLFFRENMRVVLTRLQAAGIPIGVMLPPLETRPAGVEALRHLNDTLQALCIELTIPTLDLLAQMTPAVIPERPPLDWRMFMHSAQIQMRGTSSYADWQQQGGYRYSFDGIHLTQSGAEQIASAFLEWWPH